VSEERPLFFYDLGSPHAYLMAERVNSALPVVPEWRPIHAPARPFDRDEIEREAAEHGLMPLRWPPVWPPDTRTAMLAATFAKESGRAVAFSLAAFRQAFAAGRDLGDIDTVLLAAAACELHPRAVLKGIETRSVCEKLAAATAEAAALGVTSTPAIVIGDQVLERISD
jgi:2-hydroxychromene-2-carboxylate isomerase